MSIPRANEKQGLTPKEKNKERNGLKKVKKKRIPGREATKRTEKFPSDYVVLPEVGGTTGLVMPLAKGAPA